MSGHRSWKSRASRAWPAGASTPLELPARFTHEPSWWNSFGSGFRNCAGAMRTGRPGSPSEALQKSGQASDGCQYASVGTIPQGTGVLRRTLIWPLLSTGAPGTAGRFFSFRVVITGPRLTARLLATPRASGNGVSTKLHQTLIQGSATASFSKRRRLRARHPRPRNSCVPPRRPFKALGSRPGGGPSSVLARRAGSLGAKGQQRCPPINKAGHRAGGQSKQRGRGLWRSAASGLRCPTPSAAA